MGAKNPGQRTGITTTPRNVFIGPYSVLPGPITINATYAIDGANTNRTDELRGGCLMARINSGLWVPLKLTRVAAGFSGSGTGPGGVSLPVDDARFFKAGDPITVKRGKVNAPETGSGSDLNTVVDAVDYVNNVLTLADPASDPSLGDPVFGRNALAGSGICRGILLNTVRLLSTEPFNTIEYDTVGQIVYAGLVDASQLLGDLAAVRADTLTHAIKGILFDDDQGKS